MAYYTRRDRMTTAIKGKLLLDGTGAEPVANPVILVEGDTIVGVGPQGDVPVDPGAEVVDLSDKTILPGLMDAHVHLVGMKSMEDLIELVRTPPPLSALRTTVDARTLLEAGFTAVRTVGGPVSMYLKRAIEEGVVQGPRIMDSGRSFIQTSGGGDPWDMPLECMQVAASLGRGLAETVDGPVECRKGVRRRLREGADLIKILTTGAVFSKENPPTRVGFTQPEIDALVDEAHRLGLKVAAHAHGTEGIRGALLAGVDSIEHGTFLDEECIDLMLAQGTYLVPTFAIFHRMLDSMGEQVPEYAMRQGREVHEAHERNFLKAYRAGVKIGCGTDFVGPPPIEHGPNALELVYLVEVGMAPMDVIVSATLGNADLLGLGGQTGTITAGKWADIIAADANPLEDMQTLLDVPFVMKGGEIVKQVVA
jgi:imidazolonepropionase-like amidohydrolase